MLLQNIDSLKNKTNRFDHLLETIKPHIPVLSEHWLKDNQLINTKLTGYNLIGGFTRNLSKKGGVDIYARENLGNKVKSNDRNIEFEALTCELHTLDMVIKNNTIYFIPHYM